MFCRSLLGFGFTALGFLFHLLIITASISSFGFLFLTPLSPSSSAQPNHGVLARSGMELRARPVALEENHHRLARITDGQ